MRLSSYPYVVVRIDCTKCSRKGQYRLARLADRYGAEVELMILLGHLAGDCKYRDAKRHIYDFCGAYFMDLGGARPPDEPRALTKLRIVGRSAT